MQVRRVTDAGLRYARHVSLPEIGADGQARLKEATVLIVGLGGLGCPAAAYLAAAGVGRLLLNDFDRVDVSNLQRQILYREEDTGLGKAEVAARRLVEINPALQAETIPHRLDQAGLRDQAAVSDAVLDGSDNYGTRFSVNEACLATRRPLVSGAAIRFEGQLAVFRNDLSDAACYRCLYDEHGDEMETCTGGGILGPVAGVIGAHMAVETIKLLLGIGEPVQNSLLLYDGLQGRWRRVSLKRDPSCPACARFRSR
jgi:molybdopterin/thiamine biosynthesis adenylyltransferase